MLPISLVGSFRSGRFAAYHQVEGCYVFGHGDLGFWRLYVASGCGEGVLEIALTVMFGAVSLLYATVGQTGGTAFLALMAFSSFPVDQMRPTALTLNVIAAVYSTWLFNRGGHVDWTRLRPFLIASLPAALIGGCVVLSGQIYSTLTGLVFLAAATTIFVRGKSTREVEAAVPLGAAIGVGAVVGLLSGLTCIGGGVFLAPVVIALRWASPKQMAAMAAPFILINSAVGLLGVLYTGQTPAAHTWAFGVAALLGAMIGTSIGLRFLSQTATNFVLAAILGIAGVQLLLSNVRRDAAERHVVVAEAVPEPIILLSASHPMKTWSSE